MDTQLYWSSFLHHLFRNQYLSNILQTGQHNIKVWQQFPNLLSMLQYLAILDAFSQHLCVLLETKLHDVDDTEHH